MTPLPYLEKSFVISRAGGLAIEVVGIAKHFLNLTLHSCSSTLVALMLCFLYKQPLLMTRGDVIERLCINESVETHIILSTCEVV